MRPYRRRYFIVAPDDGRGHRAFTARGASRIASGTPTAPWWAALKAKWDRQVEKEEVYRRRLGWQ